KCSHQRRPRLHPRKPSLQNRRYVTRGPTESQRPAAEKNQAHRLPGGGHSLQKLLLVSRQTEMGAGSALGTHPQGIFSTSHKDDVRLFGGGDRLCKAVIFGG